MIHRHSPQAGRTGGLLPRLLLSLLTALLLCALLPTARPVQALDWMTPYLDNAIQHGILREDLIHNPQPNQTISRGEFVAMVNRAYGYDKAGPTPFTDVMLEDWFYEDVGIAYNMGYFKGTSPTTASPNLPLTREQAAVILARNMMLKERSGEVLGFSDSRDFASWSRGIIEAISEAGVITGFPDGSYRPQQNVTRVQVAVMLMRAVGTPLSQPGVYAGRNYSGNVTITSPNVTLKDAVIDGDLYISGGVDLGGIVLENVNVLGRIIVSGGGESELGQRSVVLRNVQADELAVDSITDQFVTLRAEGLTDIPKVTALTHAYLEDATEDGLGLRLIHLKGKPGALFQLAGNIKEAVNLTPSSTLTIAQGTAHTVTVDEHAIGSTLNIDGSAEVERLNLDVATTVTGKGDISHLEVNAPGSTVEKLPDTVVIRPGIDANIGGEQMNSQDAVESSQDPRLLAGYPVAKNVAPTSADAVFSTNKRGTIYWALSTVSSGSVREEHLLQPPAYGGNILKSGTIPATASNTPYTAKITGLTRAGSYYITAMLVDNRGYHSPVKVAAFTTPDDTVPAFINENTYALLADVGDDQVAQAMVMANKTCKLYYVLLPKGSTAPTPNDFQTQALGGSLGHGIMDVYKNEQTLISRINSIPLEEETTYDLYLWLTDADGTKSSAVKKLTITTKDRTPPVLQQLMVSSIAAKSVELSFTVDEPATFYWAVVPQGASFYTAENEKLVASDPNALLAKLQIETGLNGLLKGNKRDSKGMTATKFTVSGLNPQTAYDLYYVVKDDAGNYALYTLTIPHPFPIHTLDDQPPTVKQEFTHDGTTDASHPTPFPDTTVNLVFSEHVKGTLDRDGDTVPDNDVFLSLYQQYKDSPAGREILADIFSHYIKLYDAATGRPVVERTKANETDPNLNWVIDYRYVTVATDPSGTGELIISFPHRSDNLAQSALNLSGGSTYYFELEAIADTSMAENRMEGIRGVTTLPQFTTISAQIFLTKASAVVPPAHDPEAGAADPWYFDFVFSATPFSHESMADEALWDLFVWSHVSMNFKVYESLDEGTSWTLVGDGTTDAQINTPDGLMLGASMGSVLRKDAFGQLNRFDLDNTGNPIPKRLYAIEVTSLGTAGTLRQNWNTPLTIRVTAVSGLQGALEDAGDRLNASQPYDQVISEENGVSDITSPSIFTIDKIFVDNTPPEFTNKRPEFNSGDSSVSVRVALDRLNSTYYYVMAPLGDIDTEVDGTGTIDDTNWTTLPEDGSGLFAMASQPTSTFIMNYTARADGVRSGSGKYLGDATPFVVDGLTPNTKYIAYFVLRGESQTSFSPQVYCFRFETGDVDTPVIILTNKSPDVGLATTTDAVGAWWLIASEMANAHPILSASFLTYVGANEHDESADGNKNAFNGAFRTYFPSNTTHADASKVTVIEALSTSVASSSTMSLFDRYASNDAKDSLQRIILAGDAGGNYTATTGNFDRQANIEVDVNRLSPHMQPVTQYYFVAAGKNTMGTKYAFKAIGNIRLVDTTPPEVSNAQFSFTSITDTAGNDVLTGAADLNDYLARPGFYRHAGTMSITFTKQPYLKVQSGTDIAPQELVGDVTAQVKVGNGVVRSATMDGMTLTIEFENLWSFDYQISLFGNGYISDVYGNTRQQQLVLWFDIPLVSTPPLNNLPELQYKWTDKT